MTREDWSEDDQPHSTSPVATLRRRTVYPFVSAYSFVFGVEESKTSETPTVSGSNSRPVSALWNCFSTRRSPVRTSSNRRVAPPGPETVATTARGYVVCPGLSVNIRTILMLLERNYAVIVIENMSPGCISTGQHRGPRQFLEDDPHLWSHSQETMLPEHCLW